jgi:hypothetical protein
MAAIKIPASSQRSSLHKQAFEKSAPNKEIGPYQNTRLSEPI